jgi:hypothetical protein
MYSVTQYINSKKAFFTPKNVIQFHDICVNVIPFTPINYDLSSADFHETHKYSTALCAEILRRI